MQGFLPNPTTQNRMKYVFSLVALASAAMAFAEDQSPSADFPVRKNAASASLREAREKGGLTEYSTVAEKLGRELIKDFPDKPESYHYLVLAAQAAEIEQQTERARTLLKELNTGNVPTKVRGEVDEALAKLDRVGKPLDVNFTAIDGREIDLAAMKGKVVLVDFWATWCGPCVAELPHVKEAYEKLHSNGFEVIGISFDQDKPTLESFVKEKGMEWPQYFDGKGWQNDFGKKYGIRGIPAIWLVNKKGELVTTYAGGDLIPTLEKLLAE
jgi:thiol-disulfide isomerase/thioredoxin